MFFYILYILFFDINSKKTPSLRGTDDENFQVDFSAGINSASKHKKSAFEQHGSKSPVPEPDKPAIVFRKRKVNIFYKICMDLCYRFYLGKYAGP